MLCKVNRGCSERRWKPATAYQGGEEPPEQSSGVKLGDAELRNAWA